MDDRDYTRNVARNLIQREQESSNTLPTEDSIRNHVTRASQMFDLAPADQEAVVVELLQLFRTHMDDATALIDKTYKPWLPARKGNIRWAFADRYRQFLIEQGWSANVVRKLDETTDQILGYLNDPTSKGSWDRRGMVVGDVQSGKTANYTGLICKAADAGYKVFIVLAGMQDSLRTQTQIRIEEGFLGYDKNATKLEGKKVPVGVGLIDSTPMADTFTTRVNDLGIKASSQVAFHLHKDSSPLIFVIKKNGSILKNLLGEWVRFGKDGWDQIKDVPLLVIDDEADQASINTNDPDEDPTTINQRIRELLSSFSQSAYVAYTATPFANIFIPKDYLKNPVFEDLFPRSFIMNIPAPSNYFGPEKLFSQNTEPLEDGSSPFGFFETIDDFAEIECPWMPKKHRPGHTPLFRGVDRGPDSLNQAILDFVLVCAARRARGQAKKHNSMLIHCTRFKDVQSRVEDQVKQVFDSMQTRIRIGDGASKERISDLLRQRWETNFLPGSHALQMLDCPPVTWEELVAHLPGASGSILVQKVNGDVKDSLQYEENRETGLNVIAIGGDKLSRGLTLEGLSISYFLRPSQMYDTLMQMGRWFGYRSGYLDLCRIYTSHELVDLYRHITQASVELREEFDRMVASGKTPRDYGHRVLSHPQILVTSRLKMQNGTKVAVSFQSCLCQATKVYKTRKEVEINHQAVEKLLFSMADPGPEASPARQNDAKGNTRAWANYLFWRDISVTCILDFLEGFLIHKANINIVKDRIIRYIRDQTGIQDLVTWSVALAGGNNKSETFTLCNISANYVERSWKGPEESGQEQSEFFQTGSIVSKRDEGIDIEDPAAYQLAFERSKKVSKTKDGTEISDPAGWSYRTVRPKERGLLIIYPIKPTLNCEVKDIPLYAIGISFPGSEKAKAVTYMVNETFREQDALDD